MINLKELLLKNDLYQSAISSSKDDEVKIINSEVNSLIAKFQQTFDSLETFLSPELLFSGSSPLQDVK